MITKRNRKNCVPAVGGVLGATYCGVCNDVQFNNAVCATISRTRSSDIVNTYSLILNKVRYRITLLKILNLVLCHWVKVFLPSLENLFRQSHQFS